MVILKQLHLEPGFDHSFDLMSLSPVFDQGVVNKRDGRQPTAHRSVFSSVSSSASSAAVVICDMSCSQTLSLKIRPASWFPVSVSDDSR